MKKLTVEKCRNPPKLSAAWLWSEVLIPIYRIRAGTLSETPEHAKGARIQFFSFNPGRRYRQRKRFDLDRLTAATVLRKTIESKSRG